VSNTPLQTLAADATQARDDEVGSTSMLDSQLKPRRELRPAPRAHADLATASALTATDQHCAAALIEMFRFRAAAPPESASLSRVPPRSDSAGTTIRFVVGIAAESGPYRQ
jgi:hypothetical protein